MRRAALHRRPPISCGVSAAQIPVDRAANRARVNTTAEGETDARHARYRQEGRGRQPKLLSKNPRRSSRPPIAFWIEAYRLDSATSAARPDLSSNHIERDHHPEQSLGIVTMPGGIHRVAERAGKARAMEWALTSEQVPALAMQQHGAVNRIVPDASLLAEATAFAAKLAAGPTRAHAAHKALLRVWTKGGVGAA